MTKIFFDSFSKDLSYHADRNRFGGYLKINKIKNSTLKEADIIVIPNKPMETTDIPITAPLLKAILRAGFNPFIACTVVL